MDVQLRCKKHWLYEWQPHGWCKWYPINRERIFHPITEDARNMFNALISGLTVIVDAAYDRASKILKVRP